MVFCITNFITLNQEKIDVLSRPFLPKTYSYDVTKEVRLNRYFMTGVKLILYTIRRKN